MAESFRLFTIYGKCFLGQFGGPSIESEKDLVGSEGVARQTMLALSFRIGIFKYSNGIHPKSTPLNTKG